MDALAKKLFVQLDDDFPGVRMQALDSLRDHLKKAGQSFRDILADIDTTEAELKTAKEHNDQWQKWRDQQDQIMAAKDQRIAALNRQVTVYKAAAKLRANWRVVAAVVAAVVAVPVIGLVGYGYISAPPWPPDADADLHKLLDSAHFVNRAVEDSVMAPGASPYVLNTIAGRYYWVLYRPEIDASSYSDIRGRPVKTYCMHVYSAPAEAANGMFLTPHAYGLFGFGSIQWPERIVKCDPAIVAEASK
jgi:hypothetical protein